MTTMTLAQAIEVVENLVGNCLNDDSAWHVIKAHLAMGEQIEHDVGYLIEASRRAIPFLRDEASKYDDDGSNEPLETIRDIESAIAMLSQRGEVES